MRKTIFTVLVAISAMVLIARLASKPLEKYLLPTTKAGIRVESTPAGSLKVDDKPMGATPYQKEDLNAGDHLVEIDVSNGSWKGYVRLSPGTLTVVNREVTDNITTASGEIITLDKGKGVSILSNPSAADVQIDGKLVGKTPLLISDLQSGEHQFLLSKSSYMQRSVRSVATEGFRLNLTVDLAVSDVDLTQVTTTPIQSTPQVIVKPTPTGFLRVRDSAGINGSEVGQVKPGDKLALLEELPGWDRVKLPDGKEGYVSAQYVEKLP